MELTFGWCVESLQCPQAAVLIPFVLCIVSLYQSNAGYYGRGAYFAESAAYSDGSYAYTVRRDARESTRQLLLVRVLCGKSHNYGSLGPNASTRALKKPPRGYHSVSGGPHKAGRCPAETFMWVVYDRAQAYPAYVVTYRVPHA